jgi:hypothetical protein
MSNALSTALGQIEALTVISRISVMRYKGTDKTLAEIAQELNVDAVVEGSAQLVGQQAGINVRLIDTASGEQLWSQSYQRDLGDLLRLQNEVAQTIALHIETRITPEEEAKLAAQRQINRKTGFWPIAHLHAALGQKDEAFQCLEKAMERRYLFFPWIRKVPTFKWLQDDPRFDDLMRRAGLEP